MLRLAMGALWLFALPAGGYDTAVQQAGYVMEDAYNRDVAAWNLARSDQPLLSSFQGISSTDQYGGLLFLSAAVYRYLGGTEHQPLLVLALAAAVSGLAVAFTWAFSRRVWGEKVAYLAAWGLALYPEAVLLGSSQMREAFTVFLVPLALYGLLRLREKRSIGKLALLAAPVLLSIPLTWAFTPSLIFMLVVAALALDEWRWLRSPKVWIGLAAAAFVILIGFILLADEQNLWLIQSARWQAYVSENASGWVARQFERLPLFGQIPFLVAYGILRPLLPAAVVATGPTVWTAIGVWRAVGWTLLLALLLYTTFLALRSKEWHRLPGALLLSSWVVSFTASYRGGGDLWDSPRYRSAFAAIQIALAAWAWVWYRETRDPWLRRAMGGAVLMIAWFIPWYLRRYTNFDWPIVDLYQVIGLGLLSAVLFVLWDWMHKE
ncbi:MAG: glycosyltransferase family 39 protein [Anaerolineales bacterium]